MIGSIITPGIQGISESFVNGIVDYASASTKTSERIVGIAAGVIVITFGFGYWFLFVMLWKERKDITNILKMLPNSIVIKNRMLRGYLVRQRKDFHINLKETEKVL